mmetsp:Transcript_22518/g.39939  ORF Transcript_22518/g.39939 Transcript_22518/m.39939 type:complete len:268 (-) Transcript_22518:95-898(-)
MSNPSSNPLILGSFYNFAPLPLLALCGRPHSLEESRLSDFFFTSFSLYIGSICRRGICRRGSSRGNRSGDLGWFLRGWKGNNWRFNRLFDRLFSRLESRRRSSSAKDVTDAKNGLIHLSVVFVSIKSHRILSDFTESHHDAWLFELLNQVGVAHELLKHFRRIITALLGFRKRVIETSGVQALQDVRGKGRAQFAYLSRQLLFRLRIRKHLFNNIRTSHKWRKSIKKHSLKLRTLSHKFNHFFGFLYVLFFRSRKRPQANSRNQFAN